MLYSSSESSELITDLTDDSKDESTGVSAIRSLKQMRTENRIFLLMTHVEIQKC